MPGPKRRRQNPDIAPFLFAKRPPRATDVLPCPARLRSHRQYSFRFPAANMFPSLRRLSSDVGVFLSGLIPARKTKSRAENDIRQRTPAKDRRENGPGRIHILTAKFPATSRAAFPRVFTDHPVAFRFSADVLLTGHALTSSIFRRSSGPCPHSGRDGVGAACARP